MSINILLVDDEEEYTRLLSERLVLRDFSVMIASNGFDAVKKIEEHSFDVVIMDVLMPGKDGIETVKEMKIIRPSLCVIMLTGHADLETAMDGMEIGAHDYLVKPVDFEELVEKIYLAHKSKKIPK